MCYSDKNDFTVPHRTLEQIHFYFIISVLDFQSSGLNEMETGIQYINKCIFERKNTNYEVDPCSVNNVN